METVSVSWTAVPMAISRPGCEDTNACRHLLMNGANTTLELEGSSLIQALVGRDLKKPTANTAPCSRKRIAKGDI